MLRLSILPLAIAATICLPAASTLASPANNAATKLLKTLRETRSMTKVGFTGSDYLVQARKVQVDLDNFLESDGARDYPGGQNLKWSAEMYVRITDFMPGGKASLNGQKFVPQLWQLAGMALEDAERCYKGIKKANACETIAQNEKRPAN